MKPSSSALVTTVSEIMMGTPLENIRACHFLVSEQESNQRNRHRRELFTKTPPPMYLPSETRRCPVRLPRRESVPTFALPFFRPSKDIPAMRRGIAKGGASRSELNQSIAGGNRSINYARFARSINYGMLAPGKHGIEKTAALCNTLRSASFVTFLAETRKVSKSNVQRLSRWSPR